MPLYLFNRQDAGFWPFETLPLAVDDWPDFLRQLLLWRNNMDIFRLNAEIVLLLLLWVQVRRLRGRWFRWLFAMFYFAAFSYYVYESIMLSLYQVDPVFYSHYQLAVDGLQVVARHLQLPPGFYLAAIVVFLATVIIIGLLIWAVLDSAAAGLSRGSKIVLTFLVLLIMLSVFTQQKLLAAPKMVVSSFGYKLQQNIESSLQVYQDVHTFDDIVAQNTYNYAGYSLLKKPNVYLIFVESYGSVLYKRDDYREQYTQLLNELQTQLVQNGWQTASTLSESPTWGGGSWMAYTSTLFGLRIDTHPQYLALLDTYQTATYPDLGHFFKTQGYEYIRLSSLSVELNHEEWQRYQNFYEMDRWLRYSDLQFQGVHYGWGPSPPDQYVLNFAYQEITRELDKPFFLFFITQNSHYPWLPLPQLAADWSLLNAAGESDPEPFSDFASHPIKRQSYFDSIDYELRFLTDFILTQGDEDSIFILIGDHQPQQVSRRNDSFDTPIHIISQDAALVERFETYGFEPGLLVTESAAAMRHEGLYSMLVRVLLAQYGQGNKVLPPYLPEGIVVDNKARTR